MFKIDDNKDCSCIFKEYLLNQSCPKIISNNCGNSVYIKGEKILRQASINENVFFVKKGLIKLHLYGDNNKEQIIKILKEGSFFGLSSLLDNKNSFFSATAITNSLVCTIRKDFIEKMITENGKFALHIIKASNESNMLTMQRYVNTVQKQVNGKVADVLLYLAESVYKSDEFVLNLTQNDLGKLIGISRENFSRTFSQFSNEGLINIEGSKCKIENKELLAKISKNG